MTDPFDQDPGPSSGPFDANMLTELLESYQQTMRAYGKAWMSAWNLATRPDPSSWLNRSIQIWQDWYYEVLEASGGWWPGARWLDRDQLSTISFIIDPAAEAAGPKEIALPIVTDGDVQIDCSDLVLLHDPEGAPPKGKKIPKLHVEAKLDRRRRTLSISLVNLKKLKLDEAKGPMQFLGCVYVKAVPAVPLMLVHVLVGPPSR